DDAEGSRMRDQLRAAARQWDERGRPRGLLWRDDALLDYRRWRALNPGHLTDVEEAFTSASERLDARGRRRKRSAAAAGVAVLLATIALLVWMNGRTGRQRASALENLARLQVENGRQALLARDNARAAAYLVDAYQHGVDTPALRFMLAQALRPLRLRPTVLHHGERLEAVAFSPDGKRLITSGASARAIVWTVEGQKINTLDLDGEVVTAAVFSPDGRFIVGTGQKGAVAVWSAADGRRRSHRIEHETTIWRLRFSPDGRSFATSSSDKRAIVWATETGQPLATLRHDTDVLDAAWSPDGTRLATAGGDGAARVWDPVSGALLQTMPGDPGSIARAIAIDPGGHNVALGAERAIHVWRLADGAPVAILSGHGGPISTLEFSRDGRLLSASWDGTAKVWDAAGGRLLASLEGHRARVWAATWSPDGERALTSSEDGTGRLWDARGVLLAILTGHTAEVTFGAFDPRGQRAVTVSSDGTARVWPVQVETTVGVASGHRAIIRSVSFSDDGARFSTWSRDGTARVWDSRTAAELASIPTQGIAVAAMGGPGASMAVVDGPRVRLYGADGAEGGTVDLPFRPFDFEIARGGARALARSLAGDLAVLDIASRRVRALEPGGAVSSAAFSARGQRIAVAFEDGKVAILDADTGAQVVATAGHTSGARQVHFCAEDARVMSAGNDGTVKLWDARSGAQIRSLVLKPGITAQLVTPDCAFLIAFGEGRPIVVLDAESGQVLDHIDVRSGEALSVSMSPDGRRLAAPTGESVWTWEIDVPEDLAPLVRFARCALPYRVEGAELVVAHPDAKCRD
ncbi:MAG TPA: hypothetical protein VMZ28_18095, partial [Kofleriaceae bacterium]|nr:hypothetical protein [Kofleriaceae bacterium]